MAIGLHDVSDWLVQRHGRERVEDIRPLLGFQFWGTMTRNFVLMDHVSYEDTLLILQYVAEFGIRSRRIRYAERDFFGRLEAALAPITREWPGDQVLGGVLEHLRELPDLESVTTQRVRTNRGARIESLAFRHAGHEFEALRRRDHLLLSTQGSSVVPIRRCRLAIEVPGLIEKFDAHLRLMYADVPDAFADAPHTCPVCVPHREE